MNSSQPKPRVAFWGSSIGLPAEQGSGQGLPLLVGLLKRLTKDFDIVLYCLIRVNTIDLPQGITVRQVSAQHLPGYVKYLLLMGRFVFDQVVKPVSLINAISAYPSGRIAIVLGRIFRRPVIVHLIGSEIVNMPEIGYGDLTKPRLKKIVSWVCRRANHIIVLTEFQKKIVLENLDILNEPTVAMRGIDTTQFPFRSRSLIFPIQFLHVASFHPVKDQRTLLTAFARIASQLDCRLTLVGDGFDSQEAKGMISDLGMNSYVNIEGVIRHSEILKYYDTAHILIHTSRYETLSGVIQEAMSSGLPVCGTDVGILADIGPTYAVIVPPNDPKQLSERILELIHNPLEFQRLQFAAREYIVGHDADWSAKNYAALFRKWIV